mmetsp:Transcript_35708/g.60485  ORF Transcript_35708/g.60485 Transcript_35708/m.60485 type:complete len:83 (-) Transcript_35708:33-281(-)
MTPSEALQLDGRIVECVWNPETREWHFLKERDDKDLPNSSYTYQRVQRSIDDGIGEQELLNWAEAPDVLSIPGPTKFILNQH